VEKRQRGGQGNERKTGRTEEREGKGGSVPVSVKAKLSFVEPGCRWAHSPFPSKAPGISYRGTMKTSVRMLTTSGDLCYVVLLSVSSGTSIGHLRVSSFFEP